jgi:hypothetical protein
MRDSLELIHQDLVEEVSWGLESLYSSWRLRGRIDPFLIIWPHRTVTFEGARVNDSIPLQLPEDEQDRRTTVLKAVKNMKAWALLLVEQRAESVLVLFESPMGTKSWRFPIVRHGDVQVLDTPKESVNTDSLGILWRPTTLMSSEIAGTRAYR